MTYRYARMEVLRFVQLYLLAAAVVRGIDYLSRPIAIDHTLALMENSGHLWVWGTIFVTFGLVGLLGEAWMQWGKSDKRWILSWMGHGVLSPMYLLFSFSALLGALVQGWGFALAFECAGYAFAHLVFLGRRKRA